MACVNISHFVDYLHSLNGNCTRYGSINGKFHHPVTSAIYIATAVLCLLLSLVTHLRYNRIKVLNLTARSNVISNDPWIFYFIIFFVRSVAGSVVYAITARHYTNHPKRLTGYFIADGALKSLEVLCLSWALNHQLLYRSQGFLQQEINNYNSEEFSSSESEHGSVESAAATRVKKNKSGAVFVTQFILALLFMALLEELDLSKWEPELFYWIYISLFWIQCISPIVLVILIVVNKNEHGPTFLVKLLLLVGVILTLPGDIPSFIWSCCMKCRCRPWPFLTGYDFALLFSIPSVIIFFIVLRAEFLRLDQEAQYHVLGGEVSSLFSVRSESIVDS